MKTKSLFTAFTGFLNHYAEEAKLIGDALEATLSALPINHDDKAKIIAAIDRLSSAPLNILEGIQGLTDETTVKVQKKDVEAAIASTLPELVEKLFSPAIIEAAVAAEIERREKIATETASQEQSTGGGE